MPRVKKGQTKQKKHKKWIKRAKGYKWGRKNRFKLAKQAVMKAWQHAYVDRRRKKREMRRLWNIKINAAARQHDLPYSKFIHGLREADIKINRKMLADLGENHPEVFEEIVEKAKEHIDN